MASRYPEFDLDLISTFPMAERVNKVYLDDLARPAPPAAGVSAFLDSLGGQLAAPLLRDVVYSILSARDKGRAIIVATGAHTVKIGLTPILIDMMRRGFITAVETIRILQPDIHVKGGDYRTEDLPETPVVEAGG